MIFFPSPRLAYFWNQVFNVGVDVNALLTDCKSFSNTLDDVDIVITRGFSSNYLSGQLEHAMMTDKYCSSHLFTLLSYVQVTPLREWISSQWTIGMGVYWRPATRQCLGREFLQALLL
jgi:hypothetical protein